MTNSMITATSLSVKEKGKVIIREKIHESFANIQYHKDISSLYASVITCNIY